MKNKKALLAVLAILFILISLELAAQDHMKKYRNFQKSVEWPQWLSSQPKKRIEAVKYAIQVSNENSKESRENERLNRKIEAIRQRIK